MIVLITGIIKGQTLPPEMLRIFWKEQALSANSRRAPSSEGGANFLQEQSEGNSENWRLLLAVMDTSLHSPETQAERIFVENFYYITMLRDPVSRYLSEWKHVQRGATWKTSLHMCDGRSPTPDELPSCYPGDDWSGVLLRDFMDCGYNLANNRQVRMLADLSLVGCYNLTFMNESERNSILLQSAKNNLKNMAFFGLTEFQRKTQYLFERTFNLKFISPFTQFNITRASNVDISEGARRRIEELNFLDVQLYEFAKDLFLQRYHYTRQQDHHRDRQMRREERRLWREHRTHRWRKVDGVSGGAVTEDYNSQVVRW
uniref:Heparan-sulfate 6-O-sulfotransferase n=1 Tax=Ornithorhynchus anatinus TaxID=9258 RepID=A0A6I8PHJ4_ORNAN